MLQFIFGAPFYVWPLFAILLWSGLKARKSHILSWKDLAIMPPIMLAWSMLWTYARYGINFLPFWAIGLSLGLWMGYLTLKKHSLKFDKKTGRIQVPGDAWPLILSMSIFTVKYTLGVIYALHPEFVKSGSCLVPEFIANTLSGSFTGRLIGYWRQYKKTPHTDL